MSTSRRSFIRKIAAGALGASVVPQVLSAEDHAAQLLRSPQRRVSPNERIRLAAIGMGIQGFSNLRAALAHPEAELVAVSDLYDGRLERSREIYGKDLITTRDYRELLQRDDIDAVIISVPDHWHDHISIEAMKAGKAVYCEKPMVHHLEEGHAVIDTQRETGQVFQVGSQRVSSIIYAKAKELYEQGFIGKLVLAEAWTDRQSALGAWQYSIPTDASPKTIDWDTFLGDAPKRPFDETRFFRWRNYTDYGTGMAGDLYVHLFSGLHLMLSSQGPERIYTSGGLRYWKDGRDVPDLQLGIYDYPETDSHPAFNLQLRCNFVDGKGGGSMTRLIGSEGVIEIGWNNVKLIRNPMSENPGYGGWDSFGTFDAEEQQEYREWYENKYPDPKPTMRAPEVQEFVAPEGYSDHRDHFANFFDAMKNDTPVVEDGAFGLRAAGPSLAANISYFENKPVDWDPEGMKVLS